MDHLHDGLLRIGVFSTLCRISVRMLRYYQDHGLLIPADVDAFTGRRYYSGEQIEQARLITSLRDAGFSVGTMASILASHDDPDAIRAALDAQRLELAAERDQLHNRLAALDRVTTILKEKPDMTDVTRTTLPEMTIASLRRTIATYGDEGELWKDLMPLVGQSGATFNFDMISGATFYDSEYRESDVDVEIWIQVAAEVEPIAPMQCRTVAAQDIVMTTLKGDYSQLQSVTSAIAAYIAEHNLTTGPMFNIYRVSPAQNPDPSAWITDVCVPIVGE